MIKTELYFNNGNDQETFPNQDKPSALTVTSPDGSYWRIVVDDNGVLSTIKIVQ